MKGLAGGLIHNSKAAMAYISKYDNVLPIWGIQKMSELEEWLKFMDEEPVLNDKISEYIEINGINQYVLITGNENVMEYNYIHDVVLQSSDAGAIYTGYSYSTYGNVVRYNCISNIGSGTFTPSGIYFDDNSSGQTAYGNVLINIPGYAFLVGGGRDNMIENNLVIKQESRYSMMTVHMTVITMTAGMQKTVKRLTAVYGSL